MSEHLDKMRQRQQGIADVARNQMLPRLIALEKTFSLDLGPLKEAARRALPFVGGGFFLAPVLRLLQMPHAYVQFFGLFSFGLLGYAGWIVFPPLRKFANRWNEARLAKDALRFELKKEVVRFLEPSFQFLNQPLFPKEVYKDSGIFPQGQDRQTAEDQCRGTLGKTPFQLTEIATYKKVTEKDSQGRTQTRWRTLYHGVVLVADFNKRFSGRILIQTDLLERSVGALGKVAQRLFAKGSDLQLVELESQAFEQKYKVMGTDPIEARYLVTPKFMEQFLLLNQVFGEGVQAAFFEGKMILSLPRKGNFFEADLRQDQLIASIETAAEELLQVLDLIEHFELNLELWKVREQKGVVA